MNSYKRGRFPPEQEFIRLAVVKISNTADVWVQNG